MTMITTVVRATRGPFLILTPICVLLGISTVVADKAPLNLYMAALVLLGALLAHISVNTFNEYFDFTSGLDLLTDKTPFSGGSGALPGDPQAARAVLITAIISLMGTALIGLFFVWKTGLAIASVGVAGLILIVTYTRWINRMPLLCLVAPGIGFGFLMVVGTQFVLEGHFSQLAWLVAAVPFFLGNNLLLLNQYPDIKADMSIGRRHVPIVYGIATANLLYACSVIGVAAVIMAGVMKGYLPELSLMALLPLVPALFALKGAVRYGEKIGGHPQYLAANVASVLLVPLFLALSLIF